MRNRVRYNIYGKKVLRVIGINIVNYYLTKVKRNIKVVNYKQ